MLQLAQFRAGAHDEPDQPVLAGGALDDLAQRRRLVVLADGRREFEHDRRARSRFVCARFRQVAPQ